MLARYNCYEQHPIVLPMRNGSYESTPMGGFHYDESASPYCYYCSRWVQVVVAAWNTCSGSLKANRVTGCLKQASKAVLIQTPICG